jgi:two-component system chemotaxis response regulator CheB
MQDASASSAAIVRESRSPSSVVVIGAGAGGPQALSQILPRFPVSFPGAVVVVQQMRPGFTKVLANHLNEICSLPVCEPVDGQQFHASEILLVPGGARFSLATHNSSDSRLITLDDIYDDPESLSSRTNQAMESIATIYGRNAIGVLLTGMGDDGRDGMRAIADAGGTTIAQDEESSVVFDLPSTAIDAGAAHQVLPLWSIADGIIAMVMGEANANAA